MASPFNSRRRRHQRAALVLVCALSLPVSTPAQAAMDDMFGVMFRMMLVMMNVMSDAMLGNNNNLGSNWGNNLGGLNSFNMGMGTWPMMSGFGSPMGMSPWSSFGSPMGMSPWNSFGNSPWSSSGSPWNSYGQSPWGMSPWSSSGGYPFAGGYPGNAYAPYASGFGNPYGGGYGYPSTYGAPPGYRNAVPAPYSATSLLEGRWYGNSGEVLEIHGNRFQLRTSGAGLGGIIEVKNNIVNLYSPQTNTVTRYTFMRNQSELLLTSGSGEVLTFRKHPADGTVRVF